MRILLLLLPLAALGQGWNNHSSRLRADLFAGYVTSTNVRSNFLHRPLLQCSCTASLCWA